MWVLLGSEGRQVMFSENEKSLFESCYKHVGDEKDSGELHVRVLGEDWHVADYICAIEKNLKKLIISKRTLYSVSPVGQSSSYRLRPTELGVKFLSVLRESLALISKNFPYYEFNPYVSIFFETAYKYELNQLAWDLESRLVPNLPLAAATLNTAIEELRRLGSSAAFKAKLRNYRRTADKNFTEVKKYINGIFLVRSRLMVVRLDLGYRKTLADINVGRDVEHRNISKDRTELFKALNKVAKSKMIGFIWKLEYGLDKSYHYHLMLLFDGSQVQEDVMWAKRVGEIWVNEITGGHGVYFNCNRKKDLYEYCGIGIVEHHDLKKREHLIQAASYLTKPDYYLRMVLPGKARALGRGMIPKVNANKGGRPRAISLSV